ncbi:hypothetical protein [Vibrio sp. 10N.237.312.B06]|uniref:hypothetical protein n=1 Tax=Vibrio sp. 10N.237.312.B06 TaxID=3229974 RepID=UPI0035500DD1
MNSHEIEKYFLTSINDCFYCNYILNHNELMTIRLNRWYKSEMSIKKIDQTISNLNLLDREVVLKTKNRECILANIRIHLNNLSSHVSKIIINSNEPFGKVIHDNKVEVKIRGVKIFSFNNQDLDSRRIRCRHLMSYGRTCRIVDDNNNTLAEVCEYVI